MPLPLKPPLPPQLARSRASLPEGEGWAYEPKYDGFRAVAFVDGDETYLQSRNGKPLSRYFPELQFPPGRYVLDGEIVAGSFDTLGQRIHPAASRIARLAEETPATYYAFDLLALDDEVLLERSYDERRAALEAHVVAPIVLTDVVRSAPEAEHWLHEAEGVIAKEAAAPYLPGERTGMIKIKRVRTVDAVVMGWRPGKAERTVGALIVGLHTPDGRLRGSGTPAASRPRRSASSSTSWRPTRPASAAAARPAAGPRDASSNGSSCGPSWWSRSPSITSPTDASATARRSSAGARTRPRRHARWTSSTSRVGQCERSTRRSVQPVP